MKISKLLSPELIKIGLNSYSKDAVIRELIEILEQNNLLNNPDEAFSAVMERELKQSTGLEAGVAVPHGKSNAVDELVGALAISNEGIDFDSLDGKPCHLFFLLIAPPHSAGQHVSALSNIAALILNKRFKRRIIEASTPEEAYAIIRQAENEDI
ncbi:PTS sugar transporter subunit IIA [bacterium]|nr:PTS sugar transporter subunit IIA [bacterium]